VPLIYRQKEKLKNHKRRGRELFRRFGGDVGDIAGKGGKPPEKEEECGTSLATF